MFQRHLAATLTTALADTPVVLLAGARQTGKSTLARQLVAQGAHDARYLTLDDPAVLAAASGDAHGFVAGFPGNVILDEVQRAPGLFLAIKAAVDRDRRPGRFLLTGSANVLLLPRVADSLAGRMDIHTLRPLSQAEIAGSARNAVETLLGGHFTRIALPPLERADLLARLVRGGYPEALGRSGETRRAAWFSAYIAALLQRDVRDLAHIEGLTDLPRLLALLAARSAALLNTSELSRSSGLANSTLKRYLALLETTYLVQPLRAWSANHGKRLVKAPKLHLLDTGLAAHLLGASERGLLASPSLPGPLLESFVHGELLKHLGWSGLPARLHHYRTLAGGEVDFLLETPGGQILGIEVKASASPGGNDFHGLRALQEAVGRQFLGGVLLHTGASVVPFGERLFAVPISVLWAD